MFKWMNLCNDELMDGNFFGKRKRLSPLQRMCEIRGLCVSVWNALLINNLISVVVGEWFLSFFGLSKHARTKQPANKKERLYDSGGSVQRRVSVWILSSGIHKQNKRVHGVCVRRRKVWLIDWMDQWNGMIELDGIFKELLKPSFLHSSSTTAWWLMRETTDSF
jgi:hypothetical protein